MRLEFDPRDANACANVIAMIASIHGSLPIDQAFADENRGGFPAALPDEEYDPAAAFDAPNPEAAFAPSPASVGPTDASADTSLSSAPAGTPVATIPPPPVGSDNGPTATIPASPSSVETDASGLPWDARIHSGPVNTKPKNADGTWRKKRGVTDEETARVTAELRQVMGAPAPAPVAATPPAPPVAEQAATQVPPAPLAAAPAPAIVPPTPVPPAPPTTPVVADMASGAPAATTAAEPTPAPVSSGNPFADLMRRITALQTSGHLTVEGTKQIAESLGITGVRDLMHRPDLIPAFDSLLPVAA